MKALAMSVLHPSHIQRGNWGLEMFQVLFLRRLRAWAYDDHPHTLVDVTQFPKDTPMDPTIEQIEAFLTDERCREGVAIDIEAAGRHPRMFGFMRLHDEAYLPVWFRHQGGAVYWSYTKLCRVVELVQNFLWDPLIPKIFQNGQAYDVPELVELGFAVNGYADGGFDTMIAHRYMYGEAPADLQFLGIVYGGLSAWKRLVKEDEEGEGK